MQKTILEVEGLKKYFPIKGGLFGREVARVHAVDGVSFKLQKGETLGLVGESGCGKSTLGRTLLRLHEPTDGRIFFEGQDISQLSQGELRKKRRDLQIVFQDPYSSLNPRMTVKDIIAEPMVIHNICKGKELTARVAELLETVGLPGESGERYPHEFSGGQRQRIGIARALALNPKLIVADEPVSALDVSIQSQILNLLVDLKKKFDLTYIFISHDLAVIEHISDKVAVMYLGRIVEYTDSDQLYAHPKHPYTQALISSIPTPHFHEKKKRQVLAGDVPSPINPPSGCYFHPRCPKASDLCRQKAPQLDHKGSGQNPHWVACHHV